MLIGILASILEILIQPSYCKAHSFYPRLNVRVVCARFLSDFGTRKSSPSKSIAPHSGALALIDLSSTSSVVNRVSGQCVSVLLFARLCVG